MTKIIELIKIRPEMQIRPKIVKTFLKIVNYTLRHIEKGLRLDISDLHQCYMNSNLMAELLWFLVITI